MKALIFVEGAVTQEIQCTFCQTLFAYLFRIPNFPHQKKSFASKEEEILWKQEEYQRLSQQLEGQFLAVRCPKCLRYQPKMSSVLRKKIKKQGIRCISYAFLLFLGIVCCIKFFGNYSWTTLAPALATAVFLYFSLSLLLLFLATQFGLHFVKEDPIAVVSKSTTPEEQFEEYFSCVCDILHFMMRNKKETLPKLDQVTQQIFQRSWKHSQQRLPWCEDLFWKIAILEQKNPSSEKKQIKQLFQAVYLLNTLDTSVYPALPKRIMEFFDLDVLTVHHWTKALGDDIHRPLFRF